jgi:hypothetical protein
LVLAVIIVLIVLRETSSGPLPETAYGPPNGRFDISFASQPVKRGATYVDLMIGRSYFKMTPVASDYFANLGAGGDAFEEVQVAVFPHAPKQLKKFWWYFGYHAKEWHGLPAVGFDNACREGDSPITCTGRNAAAVIADGRVFYELSASRVSESEVQRFMSSLHPQ